MTRKDEKDSERPHYYSQFWLDVAAGRREIGGSRAEESAEADDLPEPIAARKSGRATASAVLDGHRNARPGDIDEDDFSTNEPDVEEEEEDFSEPVMEEDELTADLDEENTPDILFGDTTGKALEEPAEDELPVEEELEDEDYFDEEEDEDEDGWAARGRKKPKPGRQVKTPKPPIKKPKRGGRPY